MKYNLSEITEVIKNRRTIYPEQFSDRVVQKEMVEKILSNAIWAPNHGMTQPWRFTVFMGLGLKKFSDAHGKMYRKNSTSETFSESKFNTITQRPLKASVVIAVSMKRQETEKIKEIEEVEAVACAIQNMYLTCTAYGLGAYWGTGGETYSDEMKKYLGLSEKDKCLGLFFIGYPSIDWPTSSRKPIEYVTTWITE